MVQSVLECSNYSACIYFENHAGAVMYSALTHILEQILKPNNSCGSWSLFGVRIRKLTTVSFDGFGKIQVIKCKQSL